jgi:DNA integrity scanning protein DisA with diadenylate cyclase activity
MITYNIKGLSVNIPKEETLTITKSRLLKSNGTQTMQQIITLMRLVLSQNYLNFQNKVYQPEKGVSMRSSISSTIAKIFLRYFEDIHIKQLPNTKNKIFHISYIDDILIIYDTKITHPDLINTHISQTHTNIKINPTYEKTTDV